MIDLTKARCLSVRQPWADAILCGLKQMENRTWTTDYRGTVLIHAGSNKANLKALEQEANLKYPDKSPAMGAFVGCADLVSVEPLSELLESDPWSSGPYCWRFANPRRFPEAVVAKGKLQLYLVEEALIPPLHDAITSSKQVTPSRALGEWFEVLARQRAGDRRLNTLLDSYFELEDAENALRIAEKMVDSNRTADSLTQRGWAKHLGEDSTGAIRDAESAKVLDPSNYQPFMLAHFVHKQLGNQNEADAEYQRAVELGFVAHQEPDEAED